MVANEVVLEDKGFCTVALLQQNKPFLKIKIKLVYSSYGAQGQEDSKSKPTCLLAKIGKNYSKC